ncbi:MinD/ParA family ATP-binding protein [Nocardia terrae]
MSEAAAAGLTGPHTAVPPQGQGAPGQPIWGPGAPGPAYGGDAPNQNHWGAPNPAPPYPNGPLVPDNGSMPWQQGAPGQMPWGAPGPQPTSSGAPGTGEQEQGPGRVPDGPATSAPHFVPAQQPMPQGGYGPGEAGQAPWNGMGSEQAAGYSGGPVQNPNFMPGPGQAGPGNGQYGPGGPGQPGYGAPAQAWGANGPGGPAPSLDDVQVRRAKKAAGSGWRKAVHHMSGGTINPGMSAEERRLQELVARIRQPVRGDYRIAVLSLKGGVGKTTTTMGLGSIFSSIRGDRVIAVDANPDFGTLSQRVPLQTRSTVRDLLLDEHIQRYSDVRRHTSQGSSRLEVLASERDPAASEAFSEEEYRAVARILQRFYNIILTDCGTGLMHSAMAGVLDLAHSLVLISSSAIDGARSAAATLDWLSLHGHDHLVRNAVVVINLPRPGAPNVGINQLRDYFLSRCRAVHIIPYDAHLGEGAEIDLHRLSKPTKRAYVELAATVADDFTADHRRYRG